MSTSHINLHLKSYPLVAVGDPKDVSDDRAICLVISRPHKANALTSDMVEQATFMLEEVSKRSDLRVFVIYGEGSHFCSGVDLQWMQNSVRGSYKEQKRDGELLQRFFSVLYHLPCPTIAMVHGSCAGGGLGIMSVCDSVIVREQSRLFLGEVNVGLLPATILPYLARIIPYGHLKRYAMSAQAISLKDALAYGLCHRTFVHQSEVILAKEINCYLSGSLHVQRRLKELLRKGVLEEYSGVEEFSRMLSSEEACMGLDAFCEKHSPAWSVKLSGFIKLPF